ncbi:putative uncharacterized protein [Alistipes sp. CAG:831]|nr:putative uncharacterized protein [Alistipes sp. CAG:831]
MKRATITMDGSGRVAVPSDIANVWMSEMELVTLFDVIAPTLRAAVRAVYRSGVLQSCEVERRIRLPNGYYLEVYALPMVMALAFRINTSNAARVRNVLLERLCLRKDRQMLWLSLGNSISCKQYHGKIASLCLGQTKTACYPQLVETSFYLCPNPTQTCLCDA